MGESTGQHRRNAADWWSAAPGGARPSTAGEPGPRSLLHGPGLPARLAQEMSDALLDTIQLVQEPTSALEWAAHVDYLRRLRRLAQHALAVGSAFEPPS